MHGSIGHKPQQQPARAGSVIGVLRDGLAGLDDRPNVIDLDAALKHLADRVSRESQLLDPHHMAHSASITIRPTSSQA